MPLAIDTIPFEDFEVLQDMVQDGQSEIIQLGRGRMHGSISHLGFDRDFGISTGDFSVGMRADGVISETRWSFGVLLATQGPAVGHHPELNVGDIGIAAPGAERYTAFQNHTSYAAAVITPQAIERFLQPQPGAYDALLKHTLSVMHATTDTTRASVIRLKPLLAKLIEHGDTLSGEVLAFHRHNIMDAVTAPIRDAVHYRGAHQPSHEKLIREIDNYLKMVGPRPIHTAELCEVFRVHTRTLTRAFHEVLGIPPMAYLRMRRLNYVHTALRRDGPGITVQAVARAHGFLELGQFAAAYKRMFGELPHHTLKRARGLVATCALLFALSFTLTACRPSTSSHAAGPPQHQQWT